MLGKMVVVMVEGYGPAKTLKVVQKQKYVQVKGFLISAHLSARWSGGSLVVI